MSLRNSIVSAGLVALLVAGPCALVALPAQVAQADVEDELAAAAERLETLGVELAALQEELESATHDLELTDYAIAEKQDEIETTRAELEERQEALGDSMRSSYKSGVEGLLEFILGSTSAEELVSRIYYLDKISEQQAANIEAVRELSARLEEEMAELEEQEETQSQQVSDLQEQVSAYEASVSEATTYYESLSAELQALLAAEAEENESVSTAVSAVETSQAQQATTTTDDSSSDSSSGSSSSDSSSGSGSSSSSGGSSSSDSGSSSSGGSSSSDGSSGGSGSSDGSSSSSDSSTSSSVAQAVATAYAQLGKAYVYGASGPDSFDCSGLVVYCFGYARGRTTYAMMSSLKASGDWVTDMSQLQVGDLVFPSTGHVGIYVGNGQYIHAANPSRGVVLDTLTSFIGGGSYY